MIKALIEEYTKSNSQTTYLTIKDIVKSCLNYADYLYSSRWKPTPHEHYDEFLELFDKKDPLLMKIYNEVWGK